MTIRAVFSLSCLKFTQVFFKKDKIPQNTDNYWQIISKLKVEKTKCLLLEVGLTYNECTRNKYVHIDVSNENQLC
jgi:hypothetical protein